MSTTPTTPPEEPVTVEQTVSERILTSFFDELQKLEGFAEVSDRLRATVMSGQRSEAAIRRALFDTSG